MNSKAKSVSITTEFITLGQFLKLTRIISNGGEEKAFLVTHDVQVNSEREIRRGRKLRLGDVVLVDNVSYIVCSSNT